MALLELEDILWYKLADSGGIHLSKVVHYTLRMESFSARGKWPHMLQGRTVAFSFRRV
ncbi:hypothetical protein BDZ85DRAFT_268229 [Elsinoe ampelina]|uniref:Uncharacterized protein n=1 Tax=Elsinoe ampelina TaxID=302913 RepID=A0A6A6G293_9PEZI|nr:hypothetical protein BDZ85DRAFT_268229 [Elsinoe ampelina]